MIARSRVTAAPAFLFSLLRMHKHPNLRVLPRQFPCWLHHMLSLECPLILQVGMGNLSLHSPGKFDSEPVDIHSLILLIHGVGALYWVNGQNQQWLSALRQIEFSAPMVLVLTDQ
jgi:hypothetical protein